MNEFGQKGKVPLSERLSVSPEEASALTGIGFDLHSRSDQQRRSQGQEAREAYDHPAGRFESMAQNAAGRPQAV
jgi:hypothetical protein